MRCFTAPLDTLKPYQYVVVLSFYQGKLLLSRHKDRTAWETQGGHIERGETPLDAARRERYEESGALEYTLHQCLIIARRTESMVQTALSLQRRSGYLVPSRHMKWQKSGRLIYCPII